MPGLSLDRKQLAKLFPLLIALLTFAVFLPSLKNGFVNWDDLQNLTENRHYRGLGWEQLRWMFSTFHLGPYQPLSWLTYAADYLAWGLNPFGYHLTNIILHSVNSALFWLLCLKLFLLSSEPADQENKTDYYLAAGFAALFFAVHPLRVESVTWVTERRDVLSGLFYLLTLLWYIPPRAAGGEQAGPWRRHVLPLCAFLCALLSKAMVITLPAALLLLDIFIIKRLSPDMRRWFSRETRQLWLEKVPYFALSAVFGAAGYIGQAGIGAVASYQTFGAADRAAQIFFSTGLYLLKTLAPLNLLPEYKFTGSVASWQPAAAAAAIFALTWAALAARRHWPAFLAVWLYYLATLSPVSGIVKLGAQAAADRYTYLPCLGFALLSGGALLALRRAADGRAGKLATLLACLAITALAGLTWRQQGYWHDSETLWRHALSINPDLPIARTNLGVALHKKGAFAEAAAHYAAVLRMNPGNAQAHNNLGRVLASQGNSAQAVSHYLEALKLDPAFAEAHYNLGFSLNKAGKTAEAAEQYRAALSLKPDFADAHNNLAEVLAAQGRLDEAAGHYRAALQLDPGLSEAQNNLGSILAAQGKTRDTAAYYLEALRLNPALPEAHSNLAGILAAQGRAEEAAAHYRAALSLKPDFAHAHLYFAVLLAAQGKTGEAVEHYRAVLKLQPDSAIAHNKLGGILAAQGEPGQALTHYLEALKLDPAYAEAHYNLACLLGAQGRVDEAEGEYLAALRLNPGLAEAHNNLAGLLAARGQLDAAAGHCRAALKSNPGSAAAHKNLAGILLAQGRLDEAVEQYLAALRSKPDFAQAHYGLSRALAAQGKAGPAAEHYRQALRLDPALGAAVGGK
ncbi:MAG TPA: tetratricopeptide repeat protein [Elusimicrobiales bacterium]|nr:tetratricopeptide repeat protein [Elusimicrobiales bacterium]